MGRHHASRQTGGTRRRRVGPVQHGDLPAAPGQAAGRRSAGQTRADDDGPAVAAGPRWHGGGLGAARVPRRVPAAVQAIALRRQSGGFFDDEAVVCERLAHLAGGGPGGHARTTPAQVTHRLERGHVPHVGAQRRGESVQIDGIGLKAQFTQHRVHRANTQRQLHSAAVEGQAMKAGQQAGPAPGQLLRQGDKFGAGDHAALQVFGRRRPGLDGDVMQVGGRLRVGAPGLPGGEEVQAQAKAGFQKGPAAGIAPGLGQAATGQIPVAGLRDAARPVIAFAAVAVVETGVVRAAIGQP